MGTEIERKFLVTDDSWRQIAKGVRYVQGYLSRDRERTVRIRTAGGKGYVTIKGASRGIARSEYEYDIPHDDARRILAELCDRPLIEKVRYRIPYGGLVWEVDDFAGENKGLIVAEVELEREDQTIRKPPWVGKEVSNDPRYGNSNLVENPFAQWGIE